MLVKFYGSCGGVEIDPLVQNNHADLSLNMEFSIRQREFCHALRGGLSIILGYLRENATFRVHIAALT